MQALTAVVLAVCCATSAFAWDVTDATAACYSVQDRRNQKDLYAAAADCHNYIQCFYLEDNTAVGFTRKCPAGQFWHDSVLSCMPEGATPCVDACLDDATSAKGCYVGAGCRQYFVCSNTGSYGMCCPAGTSFVAATCSCEESLTCGDACVQSSPAVRTTVKPASAYNATVCQDSFGTYISSVAGDAGSFYLVDAEGNPSTKMRCPSGYSFSLDSCRCDIESGIAAPDAPRYRRAELFTPFDTNANDFSNSRFNLFLFGGAQVVADATALGGGALEINGGRAEVPGLKNADARNHASLCAAFRCANDQCSAGGILSNNKGSGSNQFTIVVGLDSNGKFTSKIQFWHPVGVVTLATSVSPVQNAWNQFCITYDSNTVLTYFNGVVVDTQYVSGFLLISHAPFAVGNDQGLGTFNGKIDEVLITPFAMSADEVAAHRAGDRTFLVNRGFW